MSTRAGEYVTLRQVREEVGNDACRFFYVLRKSDQHLDFDLDLASVVALNATRQESAESAVAALLQAIEREAAAGDRAAYPAAGTPAR